MALGYFRIDFLMIFHVFWEPFWHRFLNFFTNGENHEFIAQGIVLEGFAIQKTIVFQSIFFFQVMSGSAPWHHFLCQKHRSMLKMSIWRAPLDFQGNRNEPSNFRLREKWCQKVRLFKTWSVLEPTLLFLKPHESSSRWDVLVFKTSFFWWKSDNLLFFLLSVVHVFITFFIACFQ